VCLTEGLLSDFRTASGLCGIEHGFGLSDDIPWDDLKYDNGNCVCSEGFGLLILGFVH